ncbi:acyltransferase family protein [Sphingomonas sp. Leaf25]|uniref:acyltransferase family protein n=1 Tax=Sphingomonas sp. Leaf25 TaxID=1735692 RepID=UPI00138F3F6B|nr:acyltransferase family protein [Sphingomonas sp. Leaf25]
MTLPVAGRLHHFDTLRALIMSIGVPLHAGLVAPCAPARIVAILSGAFRMSLFVFIAGFFMALLLGKRPTGVVLRERAIRFGVPAVMILLTVSWIERYYFINLFGAPRTLSDIVFAAPAWNTAGFDWGPVPPFVAWHSHLWFLIVVLFYCLTSAAFLRLADSAVMRNLIARAFPDPEGWRANLILSGVMTLLFVAGRIAHLLLTEPVLTGGPFNFIVQETWVFSGWFLLGILACRKPAIYRTMHSFHPIPATLAVLLLALAVYLDQTIRLRFGVVGGESVEFLVKGFAGFQICTALLWAFARWGNRPSRTIGFLSDASYTVYLFHVAVIAALGFYIARLPVANVAKWLAVIVIAYATCLLLHWAVIGRSRLLGFLFNGKAMA